MDANTILITAIIIVAIVIIGYMCYCQSKEYLQTDPYGACKGKCMPCGSTLFKPTAEDLKVRPLIGKGDKDTNDVRGDSPDDKEEFRGQDLSDTTSSGLTRSHNAQAKDGSMTTDQWQELITMTALDDNIVKRHRDFVNDKKNQGFLRQGRVWTPDSHDPEPVVPWVGLRRPRKVPVSENAQFVPDTNTNQYANRNTFEINTGW